MRASGEYDSLGQLTRVNDPVEGTTRVYRYDLGGNMVSHAKYAYTTGALGTAQGETVYSYGAAGWKDRLTALGNKALGYDAIGNLTSYNGWTYEWEAGRQLKRQVKSSGTDVKYEYDHNGMRVRKTVNGTATNYTYNGSRLVHLTTGSNKLHFYYDGQGKPALVNYNGTQYSYLYNLQGDVIGLVDSAGALVVEYKYNAWGSITGRAGSLAATLGKLNPFRYRGYVYDEETWMYWLKSRYYYPEMQRFISADVVIGKIGSVNGHNLYAYCGNEPVDLRDPQGTTAVNDLIAEGNFESRTVDDVITECGSIQIRETVKYTYIPYADAWAMMGISVVSEHFTNQIGDKLKALMGLERKAIVKRLSEYLLKNAVTRNERKFAAFFPLCIRAGLLLYDFYSKCADASTQMSYARAMLCATEEGCTGIVQIERTVYSNDHRILPVTTREYLEWTPYLEMNE